MVEVKILYGSNAFDTTWQTKKFKDETSCIEWCRLHHKNICCINDYRTVFQPISHFDIMDALRGVAN